MAKILTFGELLMRLATESGQTFSTSGTFHYAFGGSEANVGISLANFGQEVKYVSVLPNNAIAQQAKEYLHAKRLDISDMVEAEGRMGVYFVEKGQGVRGDKVVYDRAYSAFARLKSLPKGYEKWFEGVEVFFISGISFALSPVLNEMCKALIRTAKNKGVKVVFDINYREKLWRVEEAFTTVRKVLPFVDVLSAGILDLRQILQDSELSDLKEGYDRLVKRYKNIDMCFSTNRKTHSSEHYEIQGNLYTTGTLYQTDFADLPHVVDRIGGGDAYAAGIIYGLIAHFPPEEAVHFALAATMLKHTVYGDANIFDAQTVMDFAKNKTKGSIQR